MRRPNRENSLGVHNQGVAIPVAQQIVWYSDPSLASKIGKDLRDLVLHRAVSAVPSVAPKVVVTERNSQRSVSSNVNSCPVEGKEKTAS